jgi:hypothetical protein
VEYLQRTGLQGVVSPLHDKDVNANGEQKKAHYHVIVTYDGPTSFEVVKRLTDTLKQPNPQPLEQMRGYYRYLTHKDNPEKAQYSDKDIRAINGFNISDYVEVTKSEVVKIKQNLQQLIREKEITEYADLMDYLLDNDCSLEYEIASGNTYFFDKYIASRRNSSVGRKSVVCDTSTGEILGC